MSTITDNPSLSVVRIGTYSIDPGNVASAPMVGLVRSVGVGGGSTVVLIRDGETARKLLEMSDLIVPGHGQPFSSRAALELLRERER